MVFLGAQKDIGDLTQENWDRLTQIATKIICADGGVELADLVTGNYRNPVNNALAGHAYAVLCRELLKINPDYQGAIDENDREARGDDPFERFPSR